MTEPSSTDSTKPEERFRKELEALLNAHSCENASDTPDFILADYLIECLAAYDKAVTRRTLWYNPVASVRLEEPPAEPAGDPP